MRHVFHLAKIEGATVRPACGEWLEGTALTTTARVVSCDACLATLAAPQPFARLRWSSRSHGEVLAHVAAR